MVHSHVEEGEKTHEEERYYNNEHKRCKGFCACGKKPLGNRKQFALCLDRVFHEDADPWHRHRPNALLRPCAVWLSHQAPPAKSALHQKGLLPRRKNRQAAAPLS